MKNNRCIVTGGCGFIGSALVRHLCREVREVLVVDKLTYAGVPESLKEVDGKYTLLVKDICDQEAMDKAFAEFKPDTIFHLAAESHVDRSIDGPGEFVQTNVVGTATLLQAALKYWKTLDDEKKAAFRFQHISTDEVYGTLGETGFFTEKTPYSPHSPYSASKASSDHMVRAWHDTYGLPTLITNCSNNYGPYHFPEKLIPLIILNCLDGKPLPVYGKGANIRDWLYVDDHVKALCLVNDKGVPGETYNVGGHNERTNLEVVKTVCSILDELRPRAEGKYESLITYVTDRPGHDLRYAIDPAKLMNELGWQPEENFDSGIRKTVQWYLDNEWWWKPIHEGRYKGQRLGKALILTMMLGFFTWTGCDSIPEPSPVVDLTPSFKIAETNTTFNHYENRTKSVFKADGSFEIVRLSPAKDKGKADAYDTCWGFKTEAFPVNAGAEYVVNAVGSGDLPSARISAKLKWLDSAGNPVKVQDALGRQSALMEVVSLPSQLENKKLKSKVITKRMVPSGAVKAMLEFRIDRPDLKKGESIHFDEIGYYELPKGVHTQFDDVEPPMMEMLTKSPLTDLNSPISFRIKDASGVNWNSLKIKLDHRAMKLDDFKCEGDTLTYIPKTPWKMESVHSIDISVADVNGCAGEDCGFVAFTQRPIKHAKCSVRDDGMILKDGQPIFPIGYARFGTCPGNDFDVAKGIREAKANGLNCIHTYHVRGTSIGGGSNAVEVCRQIAETCSAEGMLLNHEPAFRKPFCSLKRDLALAENVLACRELPCNWMWNIGDDTCMHQTPNDLKRAYRILKAMDPEVLLGDADVVPDSTIQIPYLNFCDVFEAEVYPFTKSTPQDYEMAMAAKKYDDIWTSIALAGLKNKSVVALPQYFIGWSSWKRLPTKDELRCSTFIALACRARGLIYYAATGDRVPLRDGKRTYGCVDSPMMKETFYSVMAEVKAIEQSLILRDAVQQPTIKILEGPALDFYNAPSIRCLLKEDGCLIAANTAAKSVKAEISLPNGKKLVRDFSRNGVFVKPVDVQR